MYRTLSAPLSVQVEVTTRCQDECVHCYNFWRGKDFPEVVLSREDLLRIMSELVRLKVYKAIISGGEPLLFPDRALEAISWATARGLDCHLNSNLIALDREMARRILEAGVSSVLTSLHSYDEENHDQIAQRRGSFKKRIHGIKVALEAGLGVSVNMVVTTMNQDDVLPTGKFVAGLGVRSFNVTRATPPAGCTGFEYLQVSAETIRRHLGELLQLKEEFGIGVDALEHYPLCLISDLARFGDFAKRKCSAGVSSCTISSRGEVRPCSHAPQVYGNILEEGLSNPWLRMTEWRDGSLLPDTCKGCSCLGKCSGGCRLEAMYRGDIRGMDSHASGPQAIVSELEEERVVPISSSARLRVYPKVITRTEGFGGAIGRYGGKVSLVTKDALSLIGALSERPCFSIEGVCEEFGVALEAVVPFFTKLRDRGVLVEAKQI